MFPLKGVERALGQVVRLGLGLLRRLDSVHLLDERANDIEDLAIAAPASLVPTPLALAVNVWEKVVLYRAVVDACVLLETRLVVTDEGAQLVEELGDDAGERGIRLGQRVGESDERGKRSSLEA